MATFCRITGHSRGLPRPNYFPLLPPISPADAKRFCRITGKSWNLNPHHYIPIYDLLSGGSSVHCSITHGSSAAPGPPTNYPPQTIPITKKARQGRFRCVIPVIELSSETENVQKWWTQNVSISEEREEKYAYFIEKEHTLLMFPKGVEGAISGGDVEDLALSKDGTQIVLRIKVDKGREALTLNLQTTLSKDVEKWETDGLLHQGHGPDPQVLAAQKMKKEASAKKSEKLNYQKQIFEKKERMAEEAEMKAIEKINPIEEKVEEVLKHITAAKKEVEIYEEESEFYSSQETSEFEGKPAKIRKMKKTGEIKKPGEIKIIRETKTSESVLLTTSETNEGGKVKKQREVTKKSQNTLGGPSVNVEGRLSGEGEEELMGMTSRNAGIVGLSPVFVDFLSAAGVVEGNFGVLVQFGTNDEVRFFSEEAVPMDVLDPMNGNIKKVIPGQFITQGNEGPKFVPGKMIECLDGTKKFIPGQVVRTNRGEKFVPGQIVQTKEGSKFVPGQFIESVDGQPKFVPGQVMETEEGCARFVPGQIIETLTGGPTFIPGQVIGTEQGSKFVPGQVMETEDGDVKFVPGQVLETAEHGVRFVPGQVIETSEGLHFIAPDLTQTELGIEFSLQAFEVSPEELKLFDESGQESNKNQLQMKKSEKRKSLTLNMLSEGGGPDGAIQPLTPSDLRNLFASSVQSETQIDSAVLESLAAAGIAVGDPTLPVPSVEIEFSLDEFDNSERLISPTQRGSLKRSVSVNTFQVFHKVLENMSEKAGEIEKIIQAEDIGNMSQENISALVSKALSGCLDSKSQKSDDVVHAIVLTAIADIINESEGNPDIPPHIVKEKILQRVKGFIEGEKESGEKGGYKGMLGKAMEVLSTQNKSEQSHSLQVQEESSVTTTTIGGKSVISERNVSSSETTHTHEEKYTSSSTTIQSSGTSEINIETLAVDDSLKSLLTSCDSLGKTKAKEQQMIKMAKILGKDVPVESHFQKETQQVAHHLVEMVLEEGGKADSAMQDVGPLIEGLLTSDDGTLISKLLGKIKERTLGEVETAGGAGADSGDPTAQSGDKGRKNGKNGNGNGDGKGLASASGSSQLVREVISQVLLEDCDLKVADLLQRVKKGDLNNKSKKGPAGESDHLLDSSQSGMDSRMSPDTTESDPNQLFEQAISLAKLMGKSEVVKELEMVLENSNHLEAVGEDPEVVFILRQLLVMKKLAGEDPEKVQRILTLPHKFVADSSEISDPILKDLVERSNLLTEFALPLPNVSREVVHGVNERKFSTKSLGDIEEEMEGGANMQKIEEMVDQLLGKIEMDNGVKNDKIEEGRMMRNKRNESGERGGIGERNESTESRTSSNRNQSGDRRVSRNQSGERRGKSRTESIDEERCLVILKDDYNAIVPKEAAAKILSGEASYTLMDDTGLRFFEPVGRRKLSLKSFESEFSEYFTPPSGPSTPSEISHDVKITELGSEAEEDQQKNEDDLATKRIKLDEFDIGTSEGLLDTSIVRHKIAVRPKRSPTSPRHHHAPKETTETRDATIGELIETEEEFVRDMRFVVDNYYNHLDDPKTPRNLCELREPIFGNLKQIYEFHSGVLLEGIKYYAHQPRMIGRTFLRLERDFDKHVAYCRDEPAAQELLSQNNSVREYFEEHSQRIGDEKTLTEHLQLPLQRINDYQVLLRDLVSSSVALGEDTTDLSKALELMIAIPQKPNDLKFLNSIEGFHGNIQKLGRLLKHDWFTIVDPQGKTRERYLFLFKARILVTKVRRISEDRSIFILKDILRLPELEIVEEGDTFFTLSDTNTSNRLESQSNEIKEAWLKEIRLYAHDKLALAEHAADDLEVADIEARGKSVEKGALKPLEEDSQGKRKAEEEPNQRIKRVEREVSREEEKENILPVESSITQKSSDGSFEAVTLKTDKEEVSLLKARSSEVESSQDFKRQVSKEEERVSIRRESDSEESGRVLERKVSVKESSTISRQGSTKEKVISKEETLISHQGSRRESVEATLSRQISAKDESTYLRQVSGQEEVSITRQLSRKEETSVQEEEKSLSRKSSIKESGELRVSRSDQPRVERQTSLQRKESFVELDEEEAIKRCASRRKSSIIVRRDSVPIMGSESKRPKLKRNISSVECEPGEKAEFKCEVSSEHPSTVTWLKDNRPLDDRLADRVKISSQNGIHTLIILNCRDEDSGLYTAKATNEFGTVTCSAPLNVHEMTPEERKKKMEENSPFFLVKMKDTELLEETNFCFSISVKGEPMPNVKFFKDNKLLETLDRVRINKDNASRGSYELYIDHITPEDAGVYKCKASNVNGGAECEATVTVTNEKVLFAGLEGKRLLEPGEEPNFTWFRDGQEFNPEERFKVMFKDDEDSLALVFQHVKPDDAGLYTCVASTSSGKISCSAELTVQGAVNQLLREPEAPEIVMELTDTEVSVGGSAMMELKVKGFPKPNVVWYKDGVEVVAGGRFRFLYEDDESIALIIKGVTTADAGAIRVVATNDLGEAVTQGSLYVKAPPKFKAKMKDMACMTEQPLKMEVEVEGTPAPDLKWYKDGQLIIESERIKIVQESKDKYTITIERVTLEDGGAYSVVASNSNGQMSEFWNLVAQMPARIIERMSERIEKEEKETVTFSVKVQGNPSPDVKWTKNGQEIKSDGKRIITKSEGASHTLTIKDLVRIDTAIYECEVSNQFGVDKSSSQLEMKRSPKISEPLKDASAKKGESAEFNVKVDAFPKPKVKWFLDGIEIDGKEYEKSDDNKGTFKIKIPKVETTATVKVKVENEYGFDESSASLTVKSKPVIKEGLSDLFVKENEKIDIKVKIEGNPAPDVKWFHNGNEVSADARIKITKESTETYHLTFNVIIPADGGDWEVKATNELGEVSSKCKITVEVTGDREVLIREMSQDNYHSIETITQYPKSQSASSNIAGSPDVLEPSDTPIEQKKLTFPPASQALRSNVEIVEVVEEVTVSEIVEEEEEDSAMEELFKRVHRQRSLLEEILDREEERSSGTSTPLAKGSTKSEEANKDKTGVTSSHPKSQKIEETSGPLTKGSSKVEDGDKEKEVFTSSHPKPQKLDDGISEASPLSKDSANTEDGEKAQEALTSSLPKPEKSSYAPSKPIFEKKISETIEVVESEEMEVEVVVGSEPRPTIRWMLGSEEVTKSQRVTIISNDIENTTTTRSVMKVSKVILEDAGEIKCIAENKHGATESIGTVKVTSLAALKSPKVQAELKSLTVKEGEKVELRAEIRGHKPEIHWFKDGKEVEPKSKDLQPGVFTLKISDATPQDAGTYTIKAKNEWGEAESTGRLDVLCKPDITGMKDVMIGPGEEAIFEAIVKAHPPPKISWLKGKEALKTSDKIKTEVNGETHRLIIKAEDKSAQDTYTIKAVNDIGESILSAKLTIKMEAPEFFKGLSNVSLKDGEALELKVRLSGVPKPVVQFTRDGKPVENIEVDEEKGVYSLNIERAGPNDMRKYEVKAKNVAGEAATSGIVKMIQTVPEFTKGLDRKKAIDEGETLELKCKVDGSPLPTIQWMKDGVPVVESDRIKMKILPDGTCTLTIADAKGSDSGNYEIMAKNPNGEVSSRCQAEVLAAPKRPNFEENLSGPSSIKAGEPLKLQAKISGFPKPQLRWLKDGKPVRQGAIATEKPDGTVMLEIDAAQTSDGGKYSLVVYNDKGETSQDAPVTVLAPPSKPKFSEGLQDVQVVEGFPVTLKAAFSGNPPPVIQWLKDGKPIEAQTTIVENPDGSKAAQIVFTAGPADGGVYTLVASNPEGKVESKGQVAVIKKDSGGEPLPPKFLSDLIDLDVDEGGELYLTGKVEGNPLPDVEWRCDGKSIPMEGNNFATFDGIKVKLTMKNMRPSNAGVYECYLKNPHGEASSMSKVKVRKIYQKPKFTSKFTDTQQLPTYDSKFTGKFSGIPAPEVSWFKDGKGISDSDKYKMKREGDLVSLIVRDCHPTDAGKYSCTLKNIEGEDKCEALLEIVDKIEKREKTEHPYFLKKIGDTEVYQGMTGKFTACIGGYPEPAFEWFHNDIRLYPGERVSFQREGTGLLRLMIKNVDFPDVGTYRLRIFNSVGDVSCEGQLTYDTLDSRPKKPVGDQYVGFDSFRDSGLPLPLADRPIISRMTDRHLTLSWRPSIPYAPRFPVTYQVEMCECPEGEWFTVRKGIRSCACDIRNLEPNRDYKFRVRVENQYGVSDPSPYAVTLRSKFDLTPPRWRPSGHAGIPKDYDLDRPPHDGYTHAPRFLNQEHDTQYAVLGVNATLYWFVYGYPKPSITFEYNEKECEFDYDFSRNGQISLFLSRMTKDHVGVFEAIARNAHGEARQRVKLAIAEYPRFVQRPKETFIMSRKGGKLVAIVSGVPEPEIKWYKDWTPLGVGGSSRIKSTTVSNEDGTYTITLTLNDAIMKDEGLYSLTVTNVAGSVHTSVMIHIEENEQEYYWYSYGKGRDVRKRSNKSIHDYYDIGDELGRGTQSITNHVVERSTGKSYANKCMRGGGQKRNWMESELDIQNGLNHRNLTRVVDAFESSDGIDLVTEMSSGGEILESLTKQESFSEYEISKYIRQILEGLDHLHDKNIAHLGLNPRDLLFSRPGGDEIKICDFGLARRITSKLYTLEYGMPEFVSPEISKGQGVGYASDMWSVGIITYLLLSGVSPFRGNNDKETLENVQGGKWTFVDIFSQISTEGKDFISKLLQFRAEDRLNVKDALNHSWIRYPHRILKDSPSLNLDNHRRYYGWLRDWYSNASCRGTYRRNPLSGAFTHPSKMVYPPNYMGTPERMLETKREPREFPIQDAHYPRPDLDYEIGMIKSESHYQSGPDTYLLQLRDADFPVRLRQYMKVAASRSPSLALQLKGTAYDRNRTVIRERRRFTDVMDEEVDDERRSRIANYGDGPWNSEPRRIRHEVGPRLEAHSEADAILSMRRDGTSPFFREKPAMTIDMELDRPLELTVVFGGDPTPSIQWFKGDLAVSESSRVKVTTEGDKSTLRHETAVSYDAGQYKIVARNKNGFATTRFRLNYGGDGTKPEAVQTLDYKMENGQDNCPSGRAENYTFGKEIVRGKKSILTTGREGEQKVLIRISTDEEGLKELENIKALKHIRIANVLAAFSQNGHQFIVQEYGGDSNVLRVLAATHQYSEQTVAHITSQVLDALQYLHWRNMALLNLEPGNILIDGTRNPHVKIADFSAARTVSKLGARVDCSTNLHFTAPEILNEEPALHQTDIWSLGVLLYVLLSGVSPFKGETKDETRQNITYVRFRFEHLFKEITQEATRFIMLIFKRSPLKRPTVEEAYEHRWLAPSEHMFKKRERAIFFGQRLSEFCEEYHNSKALEAEPLVASMIKNYSIQETAIGAREKKGKMSTSADPPTHPSSEMNGGL